MTATIKNVSEGLFFFFQILWDMWNNHEVHHQWQRPCCY